MQMFDLRLMLPTHPKGDRLDSSFISSYIYIYILLSWYEILLWLLQYTCSVLIVLDCLKEILKNLKRLKRRYLAPCQDTVAESCTDTCWAVRKVSWIFALICVTRAETHRNGTSTLFQRDLWDILPFPACYRSLPLASKEQKELAMHCSDLFWEKFIPVGAWMTLSWRVEPDTQ